MYDDINELFTLTYESFTVIDRYCICIDQKTLHNGQIAAQIQEGMLVMTEMMSHRTQLIKNEAVLSWHFI